MSFKTFGYITLLLSGLITACAPQKSATENVASPEVTSPLEKNTSQTNQTNQTSQSPSPGSQKVATQQAGTIKTWEISGAMAAHRTQNKKGWTATFNWKQRGADNYQIRLFGPLGSGAVLIERENGVTTYRDGPTVKSARNSESLLKQKTGIALPAGNLYYWIRGIPAPGASKIVSVDAQNHPQVLQQAGYTIEYLKRVTVNGVDVPKQIKLQGNNVTIKVAIKQWKF